MQGADEALRASEAEIQQLREDLGGKEQELREAQSKAQAAQDQLEISKSQLQKVERDFQVTEEKLRGQANAGRKSQELLVHKERQIAGEKSMEREEALEGGLTELEALRYEVTALRNANGVLQKLNAKGSSTQVCLPMEGLISLNKGQGPSLQIEGQSQQHLSKELHTS